MASKRNGTLYVGITGNLKLRVYQHKTGMSDVFTAKYKINKLVYYYEFNQVKETIEAEKKIKGWTRVKKLRLIESLNSNWDDLDPSLRSG